MNVWRFPAVAVFSATSFFLSSQAFAGLISWTDWTSATAGANGSAYGTITLGGRTVGVAYTGDVSFAQTGSGENYWTENGTPAPYTGNTVIDNAPPPAEMIALERQGITNTLSFSAPVTNPVFAVVSLGQPGYPVTLDFDRSFSVLSNGVGYWSFANSGAPGTLSVLTGDQLVGEEVHSAIQFNGSLSSISWLANPSESWAGFTLGVPMEGSPEPPPHLDPSLLLSVDLGVGARPLPFSGPEPRAAFLDPLFSSAGLWNELGLAADWNQTPSSNPVFSNLLDSYGNPTGISLAVGGQLNSFNYNLYYGRSESGALYGDYWFFNSRNASEDIDWQLSGLEPGAEYRMVFYGASQDQDRGFDMLIDTDGDGDLSDEGTLPIQSLAGAFSTPAYVDSVIASTAGEILGRGLGRERAGGDYWSYEANWAGFQLVAVPRTPAVPEPGTLALFAIGLAAFSRSSRR